MLDASTLPARGTYQLDPPHTFIYFAARHLVVGMVRGRFDRAMGTVFVATDPANCSVDVTIDSTSLSTQNEARDDDLRGPDMRFVPHSARSGRWASHEPRVFNAAFVSLGTWCSRPIYPDTPRAPRVAGGSPGNCAMPGAGSDTCARRRPSRAPISTGRR